MYTPNAFVGLAGRNVHAKYTCMFVRTPNVHVEYIGRSGYIQNVYAKYMCCSARRNVHVKYMIGLAKHKMYTWRTGAGLAGHTMCTPNTFFGSGEHNVHVKYIARFARRPNVHVEYDSRFQGKPNAHLSVWLAEMCTPDTFVRFARHNIHVKYTGGLRATPNVHVKYAGRFGWTLNAHAKYKWWFVETNLHAEYMARPKCTRGIHFGRRQFTRQLHVSVSQDKYVHAEYKMFFFYAFYPFWIPPVIL